MKKSLIISALLGLSLIANAQLSTTVTVTNGTIIGFPNVGQGQLLINSMIVNPAGSTQLAFYDAPTTNLTWTNAAYAYRASYVTNFVTNWVNYYGATNGYTNKAEVFYSVTNAASTNFYPVRIQVNTINSNIVVLNPLQATFLNGLFVTNSGSSNATITINYAQ